jgi:hypothetical protein
LAYSHSTQNRFRNPAIALITSLVLSGLVLLAPVTQEANASGATSQRLEFESVSNARVILGDLASRSQRKSLAKSGAASPFTYTGTDSLTEATYQYQSDRNYTSTANLRESDERSTTLTYQSATNQTYRSKTGVLKLNNSGSIPGTPTGGTSRNTKAGFVTYGSAFGPQVYSKPFWGTSSYAVNFSWWAAGAGDEYEIYAFLVKLPGFDQQACTVNNAASSSFGVAADHSILAYGRGFASTQWTLASNSIPETSCYRVRFVHGTYDATGGLVVGAEFYVADFELGLGQVISFDQPSDYIRSSANQTFTASVSSNAVGASIVLTSTTTTVCTVSGTTVTIRANQSGTCTLKADSAAVGAYGSAASVFRSFTVRSSAVAPVNNGGNVVAGTRTVCNTLTAQLGEWGDGGSPLTSTTYQWLRNNSAISSSTNATYTPVAADSGKEIKYRVTRTNAIGSTTATSSGVTVVDLRISTISVNVSSEQFFIADFNSCSYSYAVDVASSEITLTAAAFGATVTGSTVIQVSGSTVVSGQPSQVLTLVPGVNTVSIVVNSGSLAQTTTLTITYNPGATAVATAPSTVSSTSATLTGVGNANSASELAVDFLWSTYSDMSVFTTSPASNPSASGYVASVYSAAIDNLTNSLTVYYQLRVGTVLSATFSFTTPAAPFVITDGALDISKNGATLSGTVIPNLPTSISFQLSTDLNSLSTSPLRLLSIVTTADGVESLSQSVEVDGLEPGTTYYFRMVGVNAVASNYGSIISFTTLADAPLITASAVLTLSATAALLPGSVDPQGATTDVLLKWSTDSALASGVTTVTPAPSRAFGNIERQLSYRLTGLTQGVVYYFRYEASNGVGGTVSSAIISFSPAPAAAPTLTGPAEVSSSETITVNISFSQAVTGFAKEDIVFTGDTTGWTLGTLSGSGTDYSITITPNPLLVRRGAIQLEVPEGVANTSGTLNLAGTLLSILVDVGIAAPTISYTALTYSFRVGDAITIPAPTNTGGQFATIELSPDTDAGITFDELTGAFGGNAMRVLETIFYTITATNPAGSHVTTISITIFPALVKTEEQPPSFTGPKPVVFIPRVIPSNTPTTVRVEGTGLRQVTGMTHLGNKLQFRIISAEVIELTLPGLSIGIKEVRFEYGAGAIVSYLNALEVVSARAAAEASASPTLSPILESAPRKTSIFGFVPGLTRFDANGRKQMAQVIKRLRGAKEIACVGFTMGPTVLRRDVRLSYNRAEVVCRQLAKAFPNAKITRLEGRQDLRSGSKIRRVEIEWKS